MSAYHAPLADMKFVLLELAGLEQVATLPGFEDANLETVAAILDEASKFATSVLDPLNKTGDTEGSSLQADGTVKTPAGFKVAYLQYAANGWNGLTKSLEFGGQGLPQMVATPVEEMWHAANMAFDLCPLLTQGAIEAIQLRGSEYLKQTFLPKMVSGKWTGTMNLTEPQAGSDLAAVRTRAVPQSDGTFKLFGQKIFITYGDHDYTENIIHLVLARLPDAPLGVKGISLFVVPKFLSNEDGTLGVRNDVRCVSLEHKLGIHASPTAVMAYGDDGGAIGHLLGEANRGLEYMFIMMNLARFSVGMEGVGISERAYQKAVAFARDRVQGRAVGESALSPPIIEHPDVRRMLMTMRAYVEAMRSIAYVTAAALDNASHQPDVEARRTSQTLAEFMVPIVKGWCTESAQLVTYLGVQVHGGMGFIEETGAAQYYRDARITTIYEGTTGIQANDFVGRKTVRDGGREAQLVLDGIGATAEEMLTANNDDAVAMGKLLNTAITGAAESLTWMLENVVTAPRSAFAGSVPYLTLWGNLVGAWQLGRGALVALDQLERQKGDAAFLKNKVAVAKFYFQTVLAQNGGLVLQVTQAGPATLALESGAF